MKEPPDSCKCQYKLSINNVNEDEFSRVFPGYISLVSLIGLGFAAKYGYRERENIVVCITFCFETIIVDYN